VRSDRDDLDLAFDHHLAAGADAHHRMKSPTRKTSGVTAQSQAAHPRNADGAIRYAAKVRAPFAVLGLATNGSAVTSLAYLPAGEAESAPTDAVSELALRELEQYLQDPGARFTVPVAPKGTPFQQRVWQALVTIPSGDVRTYGELAYALASAPRAVGQACGANPIALIVPCHRVIGAQGALGGFMHAATGDPIAIKRWLLAHEGYRPGT
jgi:methylated-DNA-[protein]-cysteine S-methyltransferase